MKSINGLFVPREECKFPGKDLLPARCHNSKNVRWPDPLNTSISNPGLPHSTSRGAGGKCCSHGITGLPAQKVSPDPFSCPTSAHKGLSIYFSTLLSFQERFFCVLWKLATPLLSTKCSPAMQERNKELESQKWGLKPVHLPYASREIDVLECKAELPTGLMIFEGAVAKYQGELPLAVMMGQCGRACDAAASSDPQLSLLQLAGKVKNSVQAPRQVLFHLCFLIPIPTASAEKKTNNLFIILRFSCLPESSAAIASKAERSFPWQTELRSWIRRKVPRVRWIDRSLLHFLMREQSQEPRRSRANQELSFREAGWPNSSMPHVTEIQQCWYCWFNYCYKSWNNFHNFYVFWWHQISKAWSGPFKMALERIFDRPLEN